MDRFLSRVLAGVSLCVALVSPIFHDSVSAPMAATSECLIQLDGDVNVNGTVTGGDVIYLCNFTFKGGPAPMPCLANGDVNCSNTVTSADIIQLVSYSFKSGAPPCDICQNSALALACQ